MRGNSGRNYKITLNCLVCILDFIQIQIRKMEKAIVWSQSQVFPLSELKLDRYSLDTTFSCSTFWNVLLNILLLDFFRLFFQCKPWNSSRCWNQLSLMNVLPQSPSPPILNISYFVADFSETCYAKGNYYLKLHRHVRKQGKGQSFSYI